MKQGRCVCFFLLRVCIVANPQCCSMFINVHCSLVFATKSRHASLVDDDILR